MIVKRFGCSSSYLFYRTCYIKTEVLTCKRVLSRPKLCYLQSLNSVATNVFPSISNKYYSQNSLKPFESNISDGNEKGKLYTESENDFYHNVLESKASYKNTIFVNDKVFCERLDFNISETEFNEIVNKTDWSCTTVEDTVQDFIKASVYCAKYLKLPISDALFTNMCIGLIQISDKLNNEQLFNSIKALCLWTPCDSVKAVNFLDVWKTLDKTCYLRLIKRAWDMDTCLYVMDLWYALKLTRLSEFVYKGQMKLASKVRRCQPYQLVQLLFIMNMNRKVHPGISMYEFEHALEKVVSNLTLEEIAVATTGFFKTQTKIRSVSLLSVIIKRLIDEVDTAHNIIIASIFKLIRYSFTTEILSDVNYLVTKMIPRLDSNNLQSCVHILLALTPMVIFNEIAVDKLVKRFLVNPAEARLKDMEKICFILSLYNYIPTSSPHVLKTILNELERPEREIEFNNHSHALINLLFYLSLLQVYYKPLIAKVLDKTWITEKFGKHPYNISRVLLALEYTVRLECPDAADMPQLLESDRQFIAKKNAWYLADSNRNKMPFFDKQLYAVKRATEKILGSEELSLVRYVLPHFEKPDIIYCLDNSNKPVTIPEEMRNIPDFSGIVRPTQPGKWFCLVVGARSMFPFSSQTHVGELVCKIRQLKIIGYTPIVIPYYHWHERPADEFVNYVRQQIFPKSKAADDR